MTIQPKKKSLKEFLDRLGGRTNIVGVTGESQEVTRREILQ